jgi:hypothetical protein
MFHRVFEGVLDAGDALDASERVQVVDGGVEPADVGDERLLCSGADVAIVVQQALFVDVRVVGGHDHHGVDATVLVCPDQFACLGGATTDAREYAGVLGECRHTGFGVCDAFVV